MIITQLSVHDEVRALGIAVRGPKMLWIVSRSRRTGRRRRVGHRGGVATAGLGLSEGPCRWCVVEAFEGRDMARHHHRSSPAREFLGRREVMMVMLLLLLPRGWERKCFRWIRWRGWNLLEGGLSTGMHGRGGRGTVSTPRSRRPTGRMESRMMMMQRGREVQETEIRCGDRRHRSHPIVLRRRRRRVHMGAACRRVHPRRCLAVDLGLRERCLLSAGRIHTPVRGGPAEVREVLDRSPERIQLSDEGIDEGRRSLADREKLLRGVLHRARPTPVLLLLLLMMLLCLRCRTTGAGMLLLRVMMMMMMGMRMMGMLRRGMTDGDVLDVHGSSPSPSRSSSTVRRFQIRPVGG